MTTQQLREELESIWIERNGTGTDSCSTCRPPIICSWHNAMIDAIMAVVAEHDVAVKVGHQDYLRNQCRLLRENTNLELCSDSFRIGFISGMDELLGAGLVNLKQRRRAGI